MDIDQQRDMRRVEAEALIKQIAQRDPRSMQHFLRVLELLNSAHPQISGKNIQLIVNTITPLGALTVKEKELLCPHT